MNVEAVVRAFTLGPSMQDVFGHDLLLVSICIPEESVQKAFKNIFAIIVAFIFYAQSAEVLSTMWEQCSTPYEWAEGPILRSNVILKPVRFISTTELFAEQLQIHCILFVPNLESGEILRQEICPKSLQMLEHFCNKILASSFNNCFSAIIISKAFLH